MKRKDERKRKTDFLKYPLYAIIQIFFILFFAAAILASAAAGRVNSFYRKSKAPFRKEKVIT